jgi:hypothetical protein
MLSSDDLDKLGILIVVAALGLGLVFVWMAMAVLNGSLIMILAVWAFLAIALGMVVGRAIRLGGGGR